MLLRENFHHLPMHQAAVKLQVSSLFQVAYCYWDFPRPSPMDFPTCKRHCTPMSNNTFGTGERCSKPNKVTRNEKTTQLAETVQALSGHWKKRKEYVHVLFHFAKVPRICEWMFLYILVEDIKDHLKLFNNTHAFEANNLQSTRGYFY